MGISGCDFENAFFYFVLAIAIFLLLESHTGGLLTRSYGDILSHRKSNMRVNKSSVWDRNMAYAARMS